MITVEGYNLYYNTSHLLSPKPKTYEEIIERLTPLECKLFYNIVSSPDCRYERKFAEGRIKDSYKNLDAESRFKNIFHERRIYANPKSYFVNKLNVLPKKCHEIKSVSFALSDYSDLHKHFTARNSEFGICFLHDFLQNRGIRPVAYVNENDEIQRKRLVFNSPHLIEVYNNSYDMRWENEWRLNYDLDFSEDDIAFVIVPQDRHEYFVNWFFETEHFQDVQILTSTTYKSIVDHLIYYPQQTDNNWRQIEILRDHNGSGLHIDPEDFNTLDGATKDLFFLKYFVELNCFAKNTILLNYESRFTNRFIKFRNKIQDTNTLNNLFQDYYNIKDNVNEPDESQRDLIIALFGDLYMMHPLY